MASLKMSSRIAVMAPRPEKKTRGDLPRIADRMKIKPIKLITSLAA